MHVWYEYSAGWLVFTLYMVMSLLFFDVFRLFCPSFRLGFAAALFTTVVILAYGYVHYRHPAVRVVDAMIDKPADIAGGTFRIVAVSDIHLGMGTTETRLREYAEMIQAQQPDLILIGGDLIDNSLAPVVHRKMENVLARLHAPAGVYMVPGNHEYISDIGECIHYLRQTPIRLLRDSVVMLPGRIQLVGRDDRSNAARLSLAQLMAQTDRARPVIVVDHQPTEVLQAAEEDVDVLFCGHTHDGQVWPLNIVARRLFAISHGYRKQGGTHICVSSGLSLWGPPFRIGTQSELVVFNLSFRQ
jgi:predicted MPP superfamily phosphohydrolase